MKKIWITSLIHETILIQKLLSLAKTYGLEAGGHFWMDDLSKQAWAGARQDLNQPEVGLWVIVLSKESWASPQVRLGLSLLALSVQADRGLAFPILLLHSGEAPTGWPTPLAGAEILPLDAPSLGAKIVARAHAPVPDLKSEYRLDLHPLQKLGLWLEIGPRHQAWMGALAGVSEGCITAHTVGPAQAVPERGTVEFAQKGIKLEIQGKFFDAWAVQNRLEPGFSYYLRLEGEPSSLLFGALPTEEQGELYSIQLH